MVTKVNIHEAEEHFAKLLNLVLSGEKFIIANEGEPIAILSPIKEVPEGRLQNQESG